MKISNLLMLIAAILGALFAGMQTVSSWRIFNEKKIEYNFKNVLVAEDMTGDISDLTISLKTAVGSKELVDPLFFDLLIQNTGDVDLAKNDFESDISFTFTGGSGPMKVQQVDQNNSSISANFNIEQKTLYISPLLLNSGDYFIVRVLLDGRPDDIKPKVRILGMKGDFNQINDSDDSSTAMLKDLVASLLALLGLYLLGRLMIVGIVYSEKFTTRDLWLLLFVVYMFSLIFVDRLNYLNIYVTLLFFIMVPLLTGAYTVYQIKEKYKRDQKVQES